MPNTDAPLPKDGSAQPGTPRALADAAFRDVHAARLHGFALLLLLGDRARAAALTERALRAAVEHRSELSHPERAAAWLRERVTRAAPRRKPAAVADGGRLALEELGVRRSVLAGLKALDKTERAALIAATIERLDRRDVSTIVHRDGRSLEALLVRAHRRYLAGHAGAAPEEPGEDGSLMSIVRHSAAKAMA